MFLFGDAHPHVDYGQHHRFQHQQRAEGHDRPLGPLPAAAILAAALVMAALHPEGILPAMLLLGRANRSGGDREIGTARLFRRTLESVLLLHGTTLHSKKWLLPRHLGSLRHPGPWRGHPAPWIV
ncbi:protein of unknown function [Candidatus Methylocalor cossyra]|uniref:Uncharacterized protein n=1 Tax=Candidatus Methylocalor cossyra TaxID=3108543 RepID=A0ABP1C851_9GAMM